MSEAAGIVTPPGKLGAIRLFSACAEGEFPKGLADVFDVAWREIIGRFAFKAAGQIIWDD